MKKFDPGVELTEGADRVVFSKPCGLGSIILIADGTNIATIKLYDHKSASAGLDPIKALATKESAVYTPAKSDSFTNGIVAVVACVAGVATGYVSIES